jgi:hypothetical protein
MVTTSPDVFILLLTCSAYILWFTVLSDGSGGALGYPGERQPGTIT